MMEKEYTYIGKLNKNILGRYKAKLISENVILTNERKNHILLRHREAYSEILKCLKDLLYNPDYILEDSQNEDTLLMIKEVVINNAGLIVVVKLNTNRKNAEKYNSILTFWRIRNRNLKRQLEKNKIIYVKKCMDICE